MSGKEFVDDERQARTPEPEGGAGRREGLQKGQGNGIGKKIICEGLIEARGGVVKAGLVVVVIKGPIPMCAQRDW